MKKKFTFTLFILLTSLITNRLFSNQTSLSADSVKYAFAPIVVTGQRFELPKKDVASSISIITANEIRQTNILTAADAISYLVPGVFTTRRSNIGYGVAALAGGSITVRGLGGKPNTQVLILIDGRPDFQGIFSHPLNDAYPLDNVDHIEVLRGPASAVYGTNAFGGVINIITKKFPVSGFDTNIQLGYGSYNTQKYLIQHSGNLGNFQYFTSVGINKSNGHREGSNFEGKNFALKLGYKITPHFDITFNGSITPYEFHDPGPVGISLMGYFDYGEITRSSLDLTLSNKFTHTNGTIKIHGNFGKHELSDGWKSDDQTNGIIAFQNFNLPHEIISTVGFDIKRFGGTSNSNGVKLGTYFNDEFALYLHLQKIFFSKIVLASGIRLEDNSHFGREWIPKFGIVYHLFAQTSLRSSVSKGFRTPSIRDLYLFPPANSDLKPERLWNYELGINHHFSQSFYLDIVGYYYEGDQLIETTFQAPGQMLNTNTASNKARGFEVTFHAKPLKNLIANISYSYLDSDETVPFAPNKIDFMMNYRWQNFNLSLYGENISNLYTSYTLSKFPPQTTIEKLSNYTLVHVKLNYQLLSHINISLGMENVLDESYEILKGYPMPGRTIFSSLNYRF